MDKPSVIFDRSVEWADLVKFLRFPGAGIRIGVVYGRRRQGKSYLLRRLVESAGGLYTMAVEEERKPALDRFAATVAADLLGVSAEGVRFDSWEAGLRTALTALPRTARHKGVPPVLVLDELPYTLGHSPEIPSILQLLYDESQNDKNAPSVRVIVCGSALSVMADFLSGTKALRGRAVLDMCLKPFSFQDSASFWGVKENPDIAFKLHAILGGTPGYRDLIAQSPPDTEDELGEWLGETLFNPSHALYGETDYLLQEDPRITDRALYQSILTAVSQGASSPSKIAAKLGRPAGSLSYPLDVLRKAGFVEYREDLLLQRKSAYTIADPIVRFHQLIALPRLAMLEERRAKEVWKSSQEGFLGGVLGPHFERIARDWTASSNGRTVLGRDLGAVGTAVVNDSAGRSQHEIDVLALAEGHVPRSRDAAVVLIGEAKYSVRPRTLGDLRRLEQIRDLLIRRSGSAKDALLVLYMRQGADENLAAEARKREDVALIELRQMYDTLG